MLRMRLMTAGAAAALLMAPAALAQTQPSNPPNVGDVPETEVNASSPRPNPGETTAPPAPTEPWTPETPGDDAVPYSQADAEGWSAPDSAPPPGEAAADAATDVEEAPMTPRPDPAMPAEPMDAPEDMAPPAPDPLTPSADPMEPPADTTVPPPPIDPAPDAGLEDDDPLDPEPPGA